MRNHNIAKAKIFRNQCINNALPDTLIKDTKILFDYLVTFLGKRISKKLLGIIRIENKKYFIKFCVSRRSFLKSPEKHSFLNYIALKNVGVNIPKHLLCVERSVSFYKYSLLLMNYIENTISIIDFLNRISPLKVLHELFGNLSAQIGILHSKKIVLNSIDETNILINVSEKFGGWFIDLEHWKHCYINRLKKEKDIIDFLTLFCHVFDFKDNQLQNQFINSYSKYYSWKYKSNDIFFKACDKFVEKWGQRPGYLLQINGDDPTGVVKKTNNERYNFKPIQLGKFKLMVDMNSLYHYNR